MNECTRAAVAHVHASIDAHYLSSVAYALCVYSSGATYVWLYRCCAVSSYSRTTAHAHRPAPVSCASVTRVPKCDARADVYTCRRVGSHDTPLHGTVARLWLCLLYTYVYMYAVFRLLFLVDTRARQWKPSTQRPQAI